MSLLISMSRLFGVCRNINIVEFGSIIVSFFPKTTKPFNFLIPDFNPSISSVLLCIAGLNTKIGISMCVG